MKISPAKKRYGLRNGAAAPLPAGRLAELATEAKKTPELKFAKKTKRACVPAR